MSKAPAVVSFSVKECNIGILEQFNDLIKAGELNRSSIFIKLMEDYINGRGKSQVERIFYNYCAKNHLSVDSQLKLLMGPYRVANDGGTDMWGDKEPLDFFEQMEANKS